MTPQVQAIMNIDEGEEVASACASPHVPETGIYKFLAKRKKDGTFEWAHFVQRDNGMKENIYRGQAETRQQLNQVLEIMNYNLKRVFGVEMRSADYDVYSLDGKKASNIRH
ncbi:MAG TPA: hypothetical protein VHM28_00580 [Anaerolineales bacterium]|jgi:hypothetical protein|nr:hypothetical protein [Anaerolineales bacterium]